MCKEIRVSKGYVAIVDDDDYDLLSGIKWYALEKSNTVYAVHRGKLGNFRMHRKIMNTPPSLEVDHLNGNGLDNRKINLRNCTHSENMLNAVTARLQSGIAYDKHHNSWRARIRIDGKRVSLGYFSSQDAAAMAYQLASAREETK